MHDQYGDGWNGGQLTVSDGSHTETFTLSDGDEGMETMDVNIGANVTLTWSEGSYDDEITFDIMGADGTTLFAQTTEPTAGVLGSFTATAPTNNAGAIIVYQHDSYGDGWNGGYITANDGTNSYNIYMEDGDEAVQVIFVNGGSTVTFSWNEGSYDDEVSFEIYLYDGTLLYAQTAEPTSGVFFTYTMPNIGGGDTPALPEGISFGPEISNAPVEAGTYYLVASSTDPDFEVTINAHQMPCPTVEDFVWGETDCLSLSRTVGIPEVVVLFLHAGHQVVQRRVPPHLIGVGHEKTDDIGWVVTQFGAKR